MFSVKVRAQVGLLWQHWDDEYVVYNPVSGDSHLLDYLTGQGLTRLEEKPMTPEQLVEELSASLGIPADEALADYVQRFLNELNELGLTYSTEL